MISLEQIRSLENKVHTAVSRIRTLSEENATMKQRLESYEARIEELQTLVAAFKADQDEIEAGIVSALRHLDALEDSITEPAPAAVEDETPTPETAESDEREPEDVPGEPADVPTEPAETPVPESGADDEATDENTTPDEDEEPELDIF